MLHFVFFIGTLLILAILKSITYFRKQPGPLLFLEYMVLMAGWLAWYLFTGGNPAFNMLALFLGWYLLYPIIHFVFRKKVGELTGRLIYTFPVIRKRLLAMLALFFIFAIFTFGMSTVQEPGLARIPFFIAIAESCILVVLYLFYWWKGEVRVYENGIMPAEKIFISWNMAQRYLFKSTNPSQSGVIFSLKTGGQYENIFFCPTEQKAELEAFLAGKTRELESSERQLNRQPS